MRLTPQSPQISNLILQRLSVSHMGNPSRLLSKLFSCFNRELGNRNWDLTEGNKKHARIPNPVALPEEITRQFSLHEIKAATYNFDRNLIIRGPGDGFGRVYKGFFNDGNLIVAVKCQGTLEGFDELQTELLLLCQLHHQHIVSLIGFCYDKAEMILVYQYMRNGTLRDHLYSSGYDPLPWKQRLEICIGAARALHYLHTGAKRAIIHRNIKSDTILLDEKCVCKLSDFGFSKVRSRSTLITLERIYSSALKGSIGYMDLECLSGDGISEKYDVFSFGVVLFEVLCARHPVDREMYLAQLARESISEGIIYDIIDPYLKGRITPECFKIFLDMACSCTSMEENSRPEMGEVELMLERALELQEKADSDKVHLAPHGEYNVYEEALFSDSDILHLVPHGEFNMYEEEASFCDPGTASESCDESV